MCTNTYLFNDVVISASFISGYGFNSLQLITFIVKEKSLNTMDPSATYSCTL